MYPNEERRTENGLNEKGKESSTRGEEQTPRKAEKKFNGEWTESSAKTGLTGMELHERAQPRSVSSAT